jgi:hypothetical protein
MDKKPNDTPSQHHTGMILLVVTLLLTTGLSTKALAQAAPGQTPDKTDLPSANAPANSPKLPPMPKGKSTVIGGQIRNVDPVRDQFTLKVFGGHSMKVLFDERTQVYRNGKRISLLDLHPEDHASVETTLDGTKIYALRIHMLSQLPEGESRARVLSYNQQTGELRINVALSQEPVTLRMPPGTPVVHVGQDAHSTQQSAPSDLVAGSVVDVKFTGGTGGHGVVTHVDVLATPGSIFVYSGKLSSLDLQAGRLVITDPRDNQTYPIVFDPSRFPVSRELRQGLAMKVTTRFDGTQYVASEITIE